MMCTMVDENTLQAMQSMVTTNQTEYKCCPTIFMFISIFYIGWLVI